MRTVSACTLPPQQAATALSAAEIQDCTQDKFILVSYILPENLASLLVDATSMPGLRLLAVAKTSVHDDITINNNLPIICSARAGEAIDSGVRPSLSAWKMSAPFLIRNSAI